MRLPLLWWVSILVTGCTVAPALAAPLCEYFSPADADTYVEAAVRALGDAESSIEDKDYAVRLLGALDTASVALGYKSSACSAVVAALASSDLEKIHHGISLSAGVGRCSNAKTRQSSDRVVEALETKHDLWSMYHATMAAQHLGLDINQKGILDKVLDLIDTDGSVRSFPGGAAEDGNAFMAVELLAKLVPLTEGDAKAIAHRTVKEMKDEVLGLEPALLVQLNRANGEDLAVKATKLKTMARELLEASHTTRPKGMLAVYEALKAIEGYPKAPLPIKLLPSSPSVDQLAAGSVSLLVTSLLGSQEKVKSASFSALLDADGSNVLASGGSSAAPLGAPDLEGLRALPSVKVAAGMYTAEFAVEVEGGEEGKSLTAKLPVAVGSDAVLTEARVAVSGNSDMGDAMEAEAATIQSYVLAPGETMPDDAHASTLEGHYVHFVLSMKGGASGATHQVFVRFTHALTGLDTFFVAAPSSDDSSGRGVSKYFVSISLGEESATFLQRSGAYKVAVLVGGPLVTPPSMEELGVIDLDFPVSKERHWPIYSRALLHETDVALGPLPEKHHTFREPEVRPPTGVSLLFAGLVLAVLAALGHGLRVVGANLRRVPDGVVGKAWCVAFQAGLAGIVALFVTYWVALTMTYTMQVLAFLSLVTTFTGRKALKTLAAEAEGFGRKGQSGDHVKVD